MMPRSTALHQLVVLLPLLLLASQSVQQSPTPSPSASSTPFCAGNPALSFPDCTTCSDRRFLAPECRQCLDPMRTLESDCVRCVDGYQPLTVPFPGDLCQIICAGDCAARNRSSDCSTPFLCGECHEGFRQADAAEADDGNTPCRPCLQLTLSTEEDVVLVTPFVPLRGVFAQVSFDPLCPGGRMAQSDLDVVWTDLVTNETVTWRPGGSADAVRTGVGELAVDAERVIPGTTLRYEARASGGGMELSRRIEFRVAAVERIDAHIIQGQTLSHLVDENLELAVSVSNIPDHNEGLRYYWSCTIASSVTPCPFSTPELGGGRQGGAELMVPTSTPLIPGTYTFAVDVEYRNENASDAPGAAAAVGRATATVQVVQARSGPVVRIQPSGRTIWAGQSWWARAEVGLAPGTLLREVSWTLRDRTNGSVAELPDESTTLQLGPGDGLTPGRTYTVTATVVDSHGGRREASTDLEVFNHPILAAVNAPAAAVAFAALNVRCEVVPDAAVVSPAPPTGVRTLYRFEYSVGTDPFRYLARDAHPSNEATLYLPPGTVFVHCTAERSDGASASGTDAVDSRSSSATVVRGVAATGAEAVRSLRAEGRLDEALALLAATGQWLDVSFDDVSAIVDEVALAPERIETVARALSLYMEEFNCTNAADGDDNPDAPTRLPNLPAMNVVFDQLRRQTDTMEFVRFERGDPAARMRAMAASVTKVVEQIARCTLGLDARSARASFGAQLSLTASRVRSLLSGTLATLSASTPCGTDPFELDTSSSTETSVDGSETTAVFGVFDIAGIDVELYQMATDDDLARYGDGVWVNPIARRNGALAVSLEPYDRLARRCYDPAAQRRVWQLSYAPELLQRNARDPDLLAGAVEFMRWEQPNALPQTATAGGSGGFPRRRLRQSNGGAGMVHVHIEVDSEYAVPRTLQRRQSELECVRWDAVSATWYAEPACNATVDPDPAFPGLFCRCSDDVFDAEAGVILSLRCAATSADFCGFGPGVPTDYGPIIGGVVGGIVGLAALTAVAVWMYRSHREKVEAFTLKRTVLRRAAYNTPQGIDGITDVARNEATSYVRRDPVPEETEKRPTSLRTVLLANMFASTLLKAVRTPGRPERNAGTGLTSPTSPTAGGFPQKAGDMTRSRLQNAVRGVIANQKGNGGTPRSVAIGAAGAASPLDRLRAAARQVGSKGGATAISTLKFPTPSTSGTVPSTPPERDVVATPPASGAKRPTRGDGASERDSGGPMRPSNNPSGRPAPPSLAGGRSGGGRTLGGMARSVMATQRLNPLFQGHHASSPVSPATSVRTAPALGTAPQPTWQRRPPPPIETRPGRHA